MGYLFSWRGRFGRVDWWTAQLLLLAVTLVFILAMTRAHGVTLLSVAEVIKAGRFDLLDRNWFYGGGGLGVMVMWAWLMANVNRMHDRDKSGWWLLVALVPVLGLTWLCVECGFLRGTDGPNAHGVRGGDVETAVPAPEPRRRAAVEPLEPVGPPAHRVASVLAKSAAQNAHQARVGRRSYL
jgi:uncharacterized membrane protein YhaH (DUF805 family)